MDSKLGKKLHYFLIDKNPDIQTDYLNYRDTFTPERPMGAVRGMWKVFKLNVRYRALYKLLHVTVHPRRVVRRPNGADDMSEQAPSESAALRPTGYESPLSLALVLSEYDVVSFDIFDTLLLRPFDRPIVLFSLIEEKLGLAFRTARVEAEQQARREAKERTGSSEVTLAEIYQLLEQRTGLDAASTMQLEIDTEMAMCFPNPFMKKVFDALKDSGKRIFITSDMYLPGDVMTRLLEKNGYTGYEELLVSCDYRESKNTTGLYRILLEKAGADARVAHVGDNERTDIENARALGIKPYHYVNVNAVGKGFRATGMSEVIGSAHAGILNSILHNGLTTYDPYYEYGLIAGGLYVLGFLNWLHTRAKERGIDKILFLARDGAIYKQIYDKLFTDIPSEYVYWSRVAAIRYCTEINRDEFLRRMLSYKVNKANPVSLEGMLRSVKMEKMMDNLKAAGYDEDTTINADNVEDLRQFFMSHWGEMTHLCDDELVRYGKDLAEQIGDAKRVAVVDVGWAGSGPLGMKYLIEQKLHLDCKALGFMAGASVTDYAPTTVELLKGTLESYMFSPMHDADNFARQMRTHKSTMCVYFEMMTQACCPSFKGIDEDGTYEFGIPEVENYDIIQRIHQGMDDYVTRYVQLFADHPMMMNIGPQDAYQPFFCYANKFFHITNHFLDFVFTRGVGGDEKAQTCETLRQMLTKLGLIEGGQA